MTHAMGQGGPGNSETPLVLTETEAALIKALRWLDGKGKSEGWMLCVAPVPVDAMLPAETDGPEVPASMAWVEMPAERVHGQVRRPLRAHATDPDVRKALVECLRRAAGRKTRAEG